MIKLVIVDDEKMIREGLIKYIPWNDLGISIVESAGDGFEALTVVARLQPDIILCDIKMPDMNGIELANKIKDILPECKIIFLSAYTDKEYLKSAIHLKAVSYLEKPVNREELKSAITDAVQAIIDEKNRKAVDVDIMLQLDESNTILKEKLALDIISRQNTPDEVERRLRALQLDMPLNGDFVTAIVKLDIQTDFAINMQQNQKEQILKSVESVYVSPQIKHIAGFKEINYILILFYGKEISNSYFSIELLMNLINSINDVLGIKISLFMGIGKHVDSIADIQESYRTAVIALQKQFFVGYNNVIIFDEKNENSYILSETLVKQLVECLKENGKGKAINLIRDFNGELKKSTNSLVNNIKDIFFKMLLSLNKFAEEFNINIAEGNNESDFLWEKISRFSVLTEIEEYMIDRIEFVFSKLNTMDNMGQNVFNIMKYIQEHYYEENLTINTIAHHIYLTSTYICMIFKNKTGKTINQYITEVRIEKAKELLREEKLKLLEISHRVGYQSSKHFTKTFKKIVGINPSDFRERLYL